MEVSGEGCLCVPLKGEAPSTDALHRPAWLVFSSVQLCSRGSAWSNANSLLDAMALGRFHMVFAGISEKPSLLDVCRTHSAWQQQA